MKTPTKQVNEQSKAGLGVPPRIGILSFHFGHNYGGVIQCLALQKSIENLGCHPEFMDFHPSLKVRIAGTFVARLPEQLREAILRWLYKGRFGDAHSRLFERFRRQHLSLSRRCNSLRALRRQARLCDALVVGSDQIWNGGWHWSASPYFLGFVNEFTGRRISYAASFGHDRQPEPHLRLAKTLLARFDSLSVRDLVSQNIVRRLCGREAALVVDPTLLVTLDEYSRKPGVDLPEAYVLVYVLHVARYSELAEIVREVRDRVGLPIVCLMPGSEPGAHPLGADHVVSEAGPAEWLWLFAHARFVCTDSFHGTLFALKQRKPMILLDHRAQYSQRLYDVADRFGIRHRLVGDLTQIRAGDFWNRGVDFEVIRRQLDSYIAESYRFLESALSVPRKLSQP